MKTKPMMRSYMICIFMYKQSWLHNTGHIIWYAACMWSCRKTVETERIKVNNTCWDHAGVYFLVCWNSPPPPCTHKAYIIINLNVVLIQIRMSITVIQWQTFRSRYRITLHCISVTMIGISYVCDSTITNIYPKTVTQIWN